MAECELSPQVVRLRPKNKRVSLEDFEEEVSDWASKPGKHRVVLICSCPSRLGDDTAVMERVEEMASEFDNIRCCWSRAGNLADVIFEPGAREHTRGVPRHSALPCAVLP